LSRNLICDPNGTVEKYEDGGDELRRENGDELGSEEMTFDGSRRTVRAVAPYVDGWMDGVSVPS
jgi:hypothetical protein